MCACISLFVRLFPASVGILCAACWRMNKDKEKTTDGLVIKKTASGRDDKSDSPPSSHVRTFESAE